jgi:fused signal recognition particle receptor
MLGIERGILKSRQSWFGKVSRLFERERIEEGVWDELAELLISADVGMETAIGLVESTRQRVSREKIADVLQIRAVLKEEMIKVLDVPRKEVAVNTRPQVILIAGVNGSGKTTSVAKLAYKAISQGKKVILAAADTFRAAASEQLKYWGEQVGAEVIAHRPGGDPGAVVFDAMEAARSRSVDMVIVDTAGRLHTRFNLMEELKKIKRVIARFDSVAPPEVVLVMDATTGQNGLAQARQFAKVIEVTNILLAKLDGTAKGGIVFAICAELKIPIAYIGVGEGSQDMLPFVPETFVEAILA